jgi:pyruvate dehydrogenase (quinone)
MGDGGMGMAMAGLEALGEGAPPVLAVVLDNRRLGAIRYEQELSGWPEFESGLCNGDLAGYARASGWRGVTIAETRELEIAIDTFLTDRVPTVLQVLCTPDEAPVPAGLPNAAKTASMAYAWVRQGRTGARSALSTLKAVVQR